MAYGDEEILLGKKARSESKVFGAEPGGTFERIQDVLYGGPVQGLSEEDLAYFESLAATVESQGERINGLEATVADLVRRIEALEGRDPLATPTPGRN